jgi:hypothetical protein
LRFVLFAIEPRFVLAILAVAHSVGEDNRCPFRDGEHRDDVLLPHRGCGRGQITPRALIEALAGGGKEAKRAFEAMMTMKKIDIPAIERARQG